MEDKTQKENIKGLTIGPIKEDRKKIEDGRIEDGEIKDKKVLERGHIIGSIIGYIGGFLGIIITIFSEEMDNLLNLIDYFHNNECDVWVLGSIGLLIVFVLGVLGIYYEELCFENTGKYEKNSKGIVLMLISLALIIILLFANIEARNIMITVFLALFISVLGFMGATQVTKGQCIKGSIIMLANAVLGFMIAFLGSEEIPAFVYPSILFLIGNIFIIFYLRINKVEILQKQLDSMQKQLEILQKQLNSKDENV